MMKKLLFIAVFVLGTFTSNLFAQRYLTDTFTNVTVTQNVVYGQNYNFILSGGDSGAQFLQGLTMDIYEPTGDIATDRPLIIYLHTGSLLPRYTNQTPTGDKTDSATVEMCMRFAQKGYVVAAVAYRTGWNPFGNQDARTRTIIRGVLRGLQDAKTAVRYFRKETAVNANPYGIDTTKIVIGGQGTGGYIALVYATLDCEAQIQLPKLFDVTLSQFYVDLSVMGDYEGFGGDTTWNKDNWPGYSNCINMTFNIGGALGDSTWLSTLNAPFVSIQGVFDVFAPFGFGTVFVPGTAPPLAVIDVSGSSDVIRIANDLGINDVFKTPALTDTFTLRADAVNCEGTISTPWGLDPNCGDEGLFAIHSPANGNGPWEWWDNDTVSKYAILAGVDDSTVLANGFAANPVYQGLGPVAGKARAIAYIDTLQGYITPRIYRVLFETPGNVWCPKTRFGNPCTVGIEEDILLSNSITIYPNPANTSLTIHSKDPSDPILVIELYNATGQMVRRVFNVNITSRYVLKRKGLPNGLYMIKVKTKEGNTMKKVVFE